MSASSPGPVAHIAHAATIAFELDALPGFDATALVSSGLHAETVDRLAAQYRRGCRTESLNAGPLHRLLRRFKQRPHPRVLGYNRRRLQAFDALVLTDAHPLPPPARPRLVLAGHGAGLRAHGRYPGVERFDLFLLPGRLKAERLKQMGYVDDRRSRIIGYPTFGLAAPDEQGRDCSTTIGRSCSTTRTSTRANPPGRDRSSRCSSSFWPVRNTT